jgi:putative lipoic acid-binding regulatory protein
VTDQRSPEDLLEFPCQYQFKAVGVTGEIFKQAIVAAIEKHIPVSADAVRSRPSGKGNYQSVSVLVTLYNYQQLTGIYAEMRLVAGLKILL